MNLPDAPFLELSFYFADKPETVALADFLHVTTRLGGQFTGEIAVHLGGELRDQPFAAITDQLLEARAIHDLKEVVQQLAAPQQRVVQVSMTDVVGVFADAPEIVTYITISPTAMNVDHHPIAIWTEGWLFSGPLDFVAEHRAEAKQAGHRVYQRFRQLVEILSPTYATIGVEQSLPCLTDLRMKPTAYVFTDFFVNANFLGASALAQIHEWYLDAYTEQFANGLYVSSTGYFNPVHKNVEGAAIFEVSQKVGTLIALHPV